MQRTAGPGLVVMGALLCAGCAPPEPHGIGTRSGALQAGSLPLTGDQWEILEMATAHGAFTVEVEIAREVDTAALARQLVEPLQDTYAEVLVYFYDRAADGPLPMVRIQWTASDGYVETRY